MEKYTYISDLGKGTFGKVDLVKEKKTGKKFAMKIINVPNKNDLENLKNEAKLMKELSGRHPNILEYEDSFYDEEKKNFVIIMEHCDGGSLKNLVKKNKIKDTPIPESNIIDYLIQLLLVLNFIHSNTIIHRDLKPENILLKKEGVLKITDFGVAIELGDATSAKTSIGTRYYSSLEILKGLKYNYSTDIWSLGCILHELCTLTFPYIGMTEFQQVELISNDTYTSSKLPTYYSDDLKNIIASMLKKDQKNRPNCAQILGNPFISNHIAKAYIEQSPHSKVSFNMMLQLHSNKKCTRLNLPDFSREC